MEFKSCHAHDVWIYSEYDNDHAALGLKRESAVFNSSTAKVLRAHGRCGASAFSAAPRGISARAPTPYGRAPPLIGVTKSKSGSDTANTRMQTRRGVVRVAESEGQLMRGTEARKPKPVDTTTHADKAMRG